MTIKVKKAIAREFLFLILCLVIVLITYCASYLINRSYQNHAKEIRTTIRDKIILAELLGTPYKQKSAGQYYLYYDIDRKFDLQANGVSQNSLWTSLIRYNKSDSIKYLWNYWDPIVLSGFKNFGFKTEDDLSKYITENTPVKSELVNFKQSLKIGLQVDSLHQVEKKLEYKIGTRKSQIERNLNYSIVISLLVFFIGRFIFYGIKWSLKTLKQ